MDEIRGQLNHMTLTQEVVHGEFVIVPDLDYYVGLQMLDCFIQTPEVFLSKVFKIYQFGKKLFFNKTQHINQMVFIDLTLTYLFPDLHHLLSWNVTEGKDESPVEVSFPIQ